MRDDDLTPATDATVPQDERPGGAEPSGLDGGASRHVRDLDLPIDAAWPLIATRDGLERWLGDTVDLEVEPGASGTIRDGDELLLAEVESIEQGRRVSLRWWSAERGARVVDLTIEPSDTERTRLVVVEVPVHVLEVPRVGVVGGGAGPSAGPQLRGPRAMALA